MADSGTLYAVLVGAIAVAFYLQIEFLYLALGAVLILLLVAESQKPRGYAPMPVVPEGEVPSYPQAGPVIIQQSQPSMAHDFIDNLVNNVTQQVMDEAKQDEKLAALEGSIKGEVRAMREEFGELQKKLDKK